MEAATNTVRRSHPGVQPRLSRDAGFLAFADLIPGLGGTGGPMVRIHLVSGERRTSGLVNAAAQDGWFSPSGRYFRLASQMADFEYRSYLFLSLPDGVALDTADTIMALPQAPPGSQVAQIVLVASETRLDGDGDGLNDHWETAFTQSQ